MAGLVPYWTQPEQLRAQKSDGWESVVDMALDIYRPNTVQGGDDRPILFYMHGGGWTQGSKKLIVPLITEMISHDWIVVSVDYRLNTKAGYPTQLLDCKRALRWVKDEIRTFGGNPNNIVVAGDSAGGQMAAMIALTPNVAEYQPGFEDVDTTVQGCLGLSAVLNLVDLENYSNHDARGRFIKEVAKREGSPESADSKLRLINIGISTGDIDTLTPVQHARNFVSEYEKTCTAPISYLEIPGGHHCFHVISSPRSWYVTIATAEWLNCHFDSGNPKSSVDITANIVNGNTRGRDKDLGSDFVLSSSKSKLQVQDIVEWGWTV
ncbi:hypothetical protein BGZ83_007807 [Gryganskiella cystojenkinii]|nr:hypothetical protein BGZ83_007807 [Gryganskiella cystojenkinii]